MKKCGKKLGLLLLLVFSIFLVLMNEPPTEIQAGAETKDMSVIAKIGSKKVNKKTYIMEKGSNKKIRLLIAPKDLKVTTKYQSSKNSVVLVNKAGILKAKKAGTARITIKVEAKGNTQRKVWFKVKVIERNKSDKNNEIPITLTIDGKEFAAKLYNNKTTKELIRKLPLTLSMKELNGNEKYYYFSESFATNPQRVSQIHAGDLKLYGSSCLVLFYESFSTSYNYTSLGYVESLDGLAEALGDGNVRVEMTTSK